MFGIKFENLSLPFLSKPFQKLSGHGSLGKKKKVNTDIMCSLNESAPGI